MRDKQTGRWRWRLALGAILAVALLLVWGAGLQEIRTRRVERTLNRFRRVPENGEPSQHLGAKTGL